MAKTIDVKEYIRSAFGVKDNKIIEHLASVAEVKTVPKKHHLFVLGETSPFIYVLLDGVLQGYFLDDDGKIITDSFLWESGSIVCGNPKLDQPSSINISCLKECRVISFPSAVVLAETLQSLEMALLFIERQNIALNALMEEKMICHYTMPIKRYFWMQKKYLEWEGLIPDKLLAAFLGMTPVTFSRIKRKIREGKLTEEELRHRP